MPDLSKADFARHRGVDKSAVSKYISRGQLTPPALRPDGKIDVDLADAQLVSTVQTLRSIGQLGTAAAPRSPPAARPAPQDLSDSRILALVAERFRIDEACDALPDNDEADAAAAQADLDISAIDAQLATSVASSRQGIVAQVRVLHEILREARDEYADELAAAIVAGLHRQARR